MRHESENLVEMLVRRVDAAQAGTPAPDTVTTGFPSLDRVLGGGFRRKDLVVLTGDVGSGKSALGLGMAIRTARAGGQTLFLSGEMGHERVMERALALEGKASIDDIRQGRVDAATRASLGAAAVRLRDSPLMVRELVGHGFEEVSEALAVVPPRGLVVVDSVQLTPPPRPASRLDERVALTVGALKALAVEHNVAVLALAQLQRRPARRQDPRPTLDDLGALGAIKQNADVVLAIYREEMYRPGQGVEGATELIIAKNRNGPTGFVDLFFYPRFLRFEDMVGE
jgi:replicative DNA helicase